MGEWAKAGENHPSYVTVMRRFGTWNNAKPGNPRKKTSRQQCPCVGRFLRITTDSQP
jgi:hypothetical protein